MMKKINMQRTLKELLKKSLLVLFILVCFSSDIFAQPATSGEINNEYFFEQPETAIPADPYVNEPSTLQSSMYTGSMESESGIFKDSSLFLWIGGLILGFIGLKFLKLIARIRILILVLGLITLLFFNANAQPQPKHSVQNDAYFGMASEDYGPIAMNAGPPPPPEIPIDGNILFLIGSGVLVGVYGIIRRTSQVNS